MIRYELQFLSNPAPTIAYMLISIFDVDKHNTNSSNMFFFSFQKRRLRVLEIRIEISFSLIDVSNK